MKRICIKHFIYLFLAFFFLQINNSNIHAQSLNRLWIPFEMDNNNLNNALVGGLTAPQFSEVDLNNDGTQDLFIFDRVGDKSLTYINGGATGEVDYSFSPSYSKHFPKLNDWVLLRDFDNDGAMDIFSYSSNIGIPGLEVHKGYYENNTLKFYKLEFYEGDYDILHFEQTNGSFTNIYISAIDYPDINDIDGDGDLDIITFAPNGGYVWWYKNNSVEMGFGTDSLKFNLEDHCFGGLYESGLSSCVCLGTSMDDCCEGFIGGDDGIGSDYRHAGSTLLTADFTNDGLKELILGDISLSHITMLTNNGTTEDAWYNDQDCEYPSDDFSAFIPVFPGAFYLDMDNDGKKDLIVSPNNGSIALNYNVVWFYKNTNNNEIPNFEFQQKNLLIDEMVDLGKGASPAFVDYNADGLMDLVVGNNTYFLPAGAKDAKLALYENTGTNDNPTYKLIDDDYLNFNQYSSSTFNFAPSFGDLDGDGDMDLLVGEDFGKFFYAENTAGAGNPIAFGNIIFNYKNLDAGQASTPFIVDLNRDGLGDIVSGNRNGFLIYYPNVGSVGNPDFIEDDEMAPNIKLLGGVDTRVQGDATGHSAPVFVDFEGEYRLFCGSFSGYIKEYSNIEDNLDGTWNDMGNYENLREGFITRPIIADLDNDGVYDMIQGNHRGGLSAFQMNYLLDGTVGINEFEQELAVSIYPNPATEYLIIDLDNTMNTSVVANIYNTVGQLIQQVNLDAQQTKISTKDFAHGIYFCEIVAGNKSLTKKIIVN